MITKIIHNVNISFQYISNTHTRSHTHTTCEIQQIQFKKYIINDGAVLCCHVKQIMCVCRERKKRKRRETKGEGRSSSQQKQQVFNIVDLLPHKYRLNLAK